MKKLLSLLVVLLVLVGCTTTNNNANNNANNTPDGDVVAKVALAGVIYEETDEVTDTLGSTWMFTGTVKEIVSDAELADATATVSNSLPVGTEVFTETDNEDSILVATGDSEYTTFTK